MLFLMIALRQAGSADLTGMLAGTIAMMGSFGPGDGSCQSVQ